MRIILGLLGIALVLLVIYDVIWTTLRLQGAGPLTSWVTTALWRLSLKVTRTHKTLAIAGFDIVLFTVALWIGLIWIGWALVMNMSPHAVVNAATGQPVQFWERLYVVGANLITFGTTEYQPDGAAWHLVATLAAANGFFLIGLVITYLLPLVQAVQQRREIAVYISALGATPDEILRQAWNGSSFGRLGDHLIGLTPLMMALGQGHLNYPVLHCFHSRNREAAIAPMVAVLDETLMLLEGIEPKSCPDRVAVYPLRGAIQQLLSTLAEAHLEPEKVPPPAPSLDGLREAGIPTRADDEFRRRVDGLTDRR
ncbi:MAG TPA: two pore domain potassium channel family protein, partial [Thermoanaerobaculia bacterium]|nr:two pore domain potassium channel family protein [Thermoanaerobaculia bacterium]